LRSGNHEARFESVTRRSSGGCSVGLEPNRIYRPPEAWKVTKVPRQMLYDALHDGELRAIRRGNHYLIPGSSLAEWIATVGGNRDD
jgi:excisionase family DNA binding protein